MIITFYQNCKLTKQYKEVYDCKRMITINNVTATPFEHYLSTLQKYTINADVVYMKNNGTFTMTLDNARYESFYQFNYIKFSETAKYFNRYCFIDDIVIGNGIATFYYSEDIWHSYSETLNINRGNVRNSLACKYRTENTPYTIINFNIKELPLEFQTNEPIVIKRILTDDLTPYNIGTKFYLIALGQRYKLKEATDPVTERKLFCSFFSNIKNTVRNYIFSASEIIEIMEQTVNNSYIAQDDYYYEFSNYTVIPSELFEISQFNLATIPNVKYTISTGEILIQEYIGIDNIYFGKETTIKNNYKNVSIGTLAKQFIVFNNGTDFNVQIRIFVSQIDFKILLCFNGKIIDITSEFSIDLPYSAITGEQFAQRKIATQLSNFTDIINIINSISSFAFGGFNIAQNSEDIVNEIPQLSEMAVNTTGDVFIAGERYKARNAEKYSNTYRTEIKGNPLISAFYGIILLEMNTDNDTEVNDVLNNYGYKVAEIIKDNSIFYPIDENLQDLKYDVIAFNSVEVYGEFTQLISVTLSNILINGVRINYGI